MRKVAIIPARMDSNRLPNKPLRKIIGYPMLHFLVERMCCTPGIDAVVVATTERSCDEPLVKWTSKVGIDTFRGDLKDVLGRFTAAATYADADIVVKANGDSPLLAPEVVTEGFHEIIKLGYEFVTGKNAYTGLPTGLGAEIIRYDVLNRLNQEVDKASHREHITTYIFENPHSFKWAPISVKSGWVAPNLDLTVDTQEDFKQMSQLIESLHDTAPHQWSIEQIISAFKKQVSLS